MRKLSIGLIGLVVLVTLFVALFTYTQREYETVVVDRFGNVVEQPTHIAYGWYLCLPTDHITHLDNRLHLYQSILQQVNTASSEIIAVRTFAVWRISDPIKFYRTNFGSDERAKSQIEQKIQGLVQQILPSHRLDEIFNEDESKVETDGMEQQIATQANLALADQGLQIARMGFSRMAFPPTVLQAVYKRMGAERQKLADQFTSLGQAKAQAIVNDGSTQADVIRADAESKAQAIRGQGDAEALTILSKAQPTPEARDFYQYWKNIETLKAALSKNSYLVLSADNPLLKPLLNAPSGGKPDSTGTSVSDKP